MEDRPGAAAVARLAPGRRGPRAAGRRRSRRAGQGRGRQPRVRPRARRQADRRLSRRWRLGLLQLGEALGDRGLAVRGLVLVDDALAHGLVELAGGEAQRDGRLIDVARLGGLAELAHVGTQLGLDGLVALARLLVLLDALNLRLDVRHADKSFIVKSAEPPRERSARPE